MINLFEEDLPERGILTGEPTSALKATGMGLMKGGANIAKAATILAYSQGINTEGTRDSIFNFYENYIKPAEDYWSIDPSTTSQAGQIFNGIAQIGIPLMLGPAAAPALIGESVINTGADMIDQGVDENTARKGAMLSGLSTYGMVKVPAAGKTLARSIGFVAANPVIGATQTALTHQLLDDSGYTEQARQYDPFDPIGRSVDAVMGLAFGIMHHAGLRSARKAFEAGKADMVTNLDNVLNNTEYKDYLKTLPIEAEDALNIIRQHQQKIRETPYDSKAPAEIRTHMDAMNKALADLAADQPVNLTTEVRDVMKEIPATFTRPELMKGLKEHFKLDDDQANAVIGLIEARAKREGETVDEHLSKRAAGIVPGMDQPGLMYSILSTKAWPEGFQNAFTHSNAATVMNHVDFNAAKAGDIEAARRVVNDLANAETIKRLAAQYPDSIVVPVREIESTGRNKIPSALAEKIAVEGGLKLDVRIVEAGGAGHKGLKAVQQMLTRKIFAGDVIKGGKYILVDDILTQGGTIHELRHHIENQGGEVVGVTGLGYAAGGTVIAIKPATITLIKERFGEQEITKLLKKSNIAGRIEALTEGEGRSLLKFNTFDALQNRIAQEISTGRYSDASSWLKAYLSLNSPDAPPSIDSSADILYQSKPRSKPVGKKWAYDPHNKYLIGEYDINALPEDIDVWGSTTQIDREHYEILEAGRGDWDAGMRSEVAQARWNGKDPATIIDKSDIVPVKIDLKYGDTVVIRYDEDRYLNYGREKIFNDIYNAVTAFAKRYGGDFPLRVPELGITNGTINDFLGTFYQQSGDTPKAAVQFLDDGRAIIHAFEKADLSSIIHEFAHIWQRDLSGPDLQITEKWLGIREGEAWRTRDHETFAKAFERYIAEGNAPSKDLQPVFEKLKTWIVDIYRRLRSGELWNVKMSPEIRGVFDRMFAEVEGPGALEKLDTREIVRTEMKQAQADIEAEARLNDIPDPWSEAVDFDTEEPVSAAGQDEFTKQYYDLNGKPLETIAQKRARLEAKLAKRDAGKQKKTAKQNTILDWILKKGKIDYNAEKLKGELDALSEGQPQYKLIINKKGRGSTLDRLALMAKEEGFINEATPDALLDAMTENRLHPNAAEDAIALQMEAEAGRRQLTESPSEGFVEDFLADAGEITQPITYTDSTGREVKGTIKDMIEDGRLEVESFEAHKDTFDRISKCIRGGG